MHIHTHIPYNLFFGSKVGAGGYRLYLASNIYAFCGLVKARLDKGIKSI